MMEFLIANMPILQNFKYMASPWPKRGHVVHWLGPDQFGDMPHPSRSKLDQGRSSSRRFQVDISEGQGALVD